MNRTWKDYPRDIELETKLGRVKLAITDADHIHARGCITVNRVPCSVGLHVFRQADNTWATRDRNDLYLSRSDNFKDASRAARMRAAVALSGAITEWAQDNAELFTVAQDAHVNNEVLRIDAELEKLHVQVDKLVARKIELLKGKAEG